MEEKETKKKLHIITGIHGNEAFLFQLLREYVQELETENVEIRVILANKEAAEKDSRYVDQDLNRSFGIQSKENKETRIARELIRLCQADLVLDLHSHTGKETFSLVSEKNLTKELTQFISLLHAGPCIVLQPQVSNGKSLIENVPNSLSIETGEHNSPEAVAFAKASIKKALLFLHGGRITIPITARFLQAEKFIYNNSNEEIFLSPELRNFTIMDKGLKVYPGYVTEEQFIPALISYSAKPGKKIFLACKEIVNGGVDHE